MTKDELIHFLAQKKRQKLLVSSEWSDLTAALAGLTQEEKDKIAKQIATGAGQTVVTRLQNIMSVNAYNTAKTEVETALVDDNLTLAELDSLL